MALIDIIQPQDADGELKAAYDRVRDTRGQIAEVHKIQSLNPKAIMTHLDLYMTLMYGDSPLRRSWREMIAVIVSVGNDCDYCINHHAEALNYFWKDEEKINNFIEDHSQIGLSRVEVALCDYAWRLTTDPSEDVTNFIDILKVEGMDDRAILDATMIIGYFNFINRIVIGLQVDMEDEGAGGYKFD